MTVREFQLIKKRPFSTVNTSSTPDSDSSCQERSLGLPISVSRRQGLQVREHGSNCWSPRVHSGTREEREPQAVVLTAPDLRGVSIDVEIQVNLYHISFTNGPVMTHATHYPGDTYFLSQGVACPGNNSSQKPAYSLSYLPEPSERGIAVTPGLYVLANGDQPSD